MLIWGAERKTGREGMWMCLDYVPRGVQNNSRGNWWRRVIFLLCYFYWYREYYIILLFLRPRKKCFPISLLRNQTLPLCPSSLWNPWGSPQRAVLGQVFLVFLSWFYTVDCLCFWIFGVCMSVCACTHAGQKLASGVLPRYYLPCFVWDRAFSLVLNSAINLCWPTSDAQGPPLPAFPGWDYKYMPPYWLASRGSQASNLGLHANTLLSG